MSIQEINNVCAECGIAANVLTCLKRFGKRPNELSFTTSTFHRGVCDVCLEEKYVTEARDFYYPDFTLLKKVAEFLQTKQD